MVVVPVTQRGSPSKIAILAEIWVGGQRNGRLMVGEDDSRGYGVTYPFVRPGGIRWHRSVYRSKNNQGVQ